jgi:hypothetical protein
MGEGTDLLPFNSPCSETGPRRMQCPPLPTLLAHPLLPSSLHRQSFSHHQVQFQQKTILNQHMSGKVSNKSYLAIEYKEILLLTHFCFLKFFFFLWFLQMFELLQKSFTHFWIFCCFTLTETSVVNVQVETHEGQRNCPLLCLCWRDFLRFLNLWSVL